MGMKYHVRYLDSKKTCPANPRPKRTMAIMDRTSDGTYLIEMMSADETVPLSVYRAILTHR